MARAPEFHWVPADRRVETIDEKPARIWTCYLARKREDLPEDPAEFRPVHHHNAFMEDYIHDWNWRAGALKYASRAVESEVFIFVEWADPCKLKGCEVPAFDPSGYCYSGHKEKAERGETR